MTEGAEAMMTAVRRYLDLVFDADAPTIRDLARSLDDLSAVYHATPVVAAEDTPDPPERDYKVDYQRVAARFPTLGLYAVADPLDLKTDKAMIGDAIDDIVDIAHELMDVAWLWEQAGANVACWGYRFWYDGHWGKHLHELRAYLHALVTR